MRTIALGDGGMRASALGFGCSAVLGRVGRKDSLAALGAAYDAGITFYDTARSYGYGESEALLGEFLRGRRDSVVVSTKFGILPAQTNFLKETVKPLARKMLKMVPSARKVVQKQIGAQFSANNFTVRVLRESVETSLRKLGTDYVDLLFMHSAPVSVLEQEDLLAELQKMVGAGKVRRVGISAEPEVIEVALAANLEGLRSFQFPCNLFGLEIAERLKGCGSDVVAVANHPFGGAQRVMESKSLLAALAKNEGTAEELRQKLLVVDDAVLADVVLNAITDRTGIQVVIPSMMQVGHLKTNVAAMERSLFSSEELAWLRRAMTAAPGVRAQEPRS
jgi:aryl-alcohol dehydrogenase-like predicted oxidoreductase